MTTELETFRAELRAAEVKIRQLQEELDGKRVVDEAISLRGEKSFLERCLRETPESDVLDRISLQARLDMVTGRLGRLT